VQDYFLVIVSEFVYIPWKHSQEQAIQCAEALAGGSNFCTPSVTVSAASDMEAKETAYLKHQVKTPYYFFDFCSQAAHAISFKVHSELHKLSYSLL
jgi:DNA polymerase epsilon subunit 1